MTPWHNRPRMRVDAFNIPTAHPADVSGLEQLIAAGHIDPATVVCIIGKTEGNGGRNDFTRDLAMMAFEDLFSRHLGIPREEVVNRMIFSLSGGTEGVVSPHIIVFTKTNRQPATDNRRRRLAMAIGYTRDFRPDEIGRM